MDQLPSLREPAATRIPGAVSSGPPTPAAGHREDDSLYRPSPYEGMSPAQRKRLSDAILREAFEEDRLEGEPRDTCWEATPQAGEDEEDWPSEVHPLHSLPHL
jgi:hypothetical protein